MVSLTLDEITPFDAPISTTDLVPTIDASNSMQQDLPCLPTLASWDDFLPNIAGLFMESYHEDVGDIIDDIHLLFEANTSSVATMNDSCTSAQQGTLCLPILASGDDFLINILGLFVESHTTNLGDFFDDIILLFDEENPSLVFMRDHFHPHVHSLHD